MLKNVVFQPNSNWMRGEFKGHLFFAKVYDEPSQFGINAGRVSKLSVHTKRGDVVYNYDRGHDVAHPIGEEIAAAIETLKTKQKEAMQ